MNPNPDHEPPPDRPEGGEELAFLERSLADLDAERAAGDISDADYRSLSDLYAGRAAAVRRRTATVGTGAGGAGVAGGGGTGGGAGATGDGIAGAGVAGGGGAGGTDIDDGEDIGGGDEGADGVAPAGRWRRRLAVLVIVAMLGTGVGVGLASALGHRTSTDTATGDIRQSTRGMLFEAQEHMAEGRFDEAEELYAAVVAAEPSSAEALAWWGWLHFQRGDLETAAERITEGVAADPAYPDARVFGAIVAFRLDRLDEAAEHLAAFDALNPPPLMVALVRNAELHARVLAGRLAAAEEADDAAAIDALLADASVERMAAAARHLADDGNVVAAVRLFGTALTLEPDNVAALVGRGALLTSPSFADFEDLQREGLAALDRATEVAPDDPEARFWRALAAARQGRFDDALADLDHLATLEAPEGLLAEAERLAAEVRAATATDSSPAADSSPDDDS